MLQDLAEFSFHKSLARLLPVIFVLFVLLGLYFSLTGTVYVMCCNPVAVLPSLGCQVFFWQISCAVVLSQCMAFYMLALSQCRPCASGIDSCSSYLFLGMISFLTTLVLLFPVLHTHISIHMLCK